MKRARSGQRTIGLDVGTRWVKAVQMRAAGEGVVIERACVFPRRGAVIDRGECERVMDVLWRQDFAQAGMIVTLPPSDLLSMTMELPARGSGAPLDQIARDELARSHRVSAAEIEMAWWELPGGQRATEGTHAMAMGCTHERAAALVEGLENAGGCVEALEPGPVALARACGEHADGAQSPGDSDGGVTAMVDVSWTGASLSLVIGGTIVYRRCLQELGLAALTREAMRTARMESEEDAEGVLAQLAGGPMSVEDGEREGSRWPAVAALTDTLAGQLADELAMALGYAERRFDAPARRVLIVGGGAGFPGVYARLSQRGGVETRVVGPASFRGVTAAADVAWAGSHMMAQAVGAAVREAMAPAEVAA